MIMHHHFTTRSFALKLLRGTNSVLLACFQYKSDVDFQNRPWAISRECPERVSPEKQMQQAQMQRQQLMMQQHEREVSRNPIPYRNILSCSLVAREQLTSKYLNVDRLLLSLQPWCPSPVPHEDIVNPGPGTLLPESRIHDTSSDSLSLTHSLTRSRSCSDSLSLALSLCLSISLSLTHTYTHTLSLTLSLPAGSFCYPHHLGARLIYVCHT